MPDKLKNWGKALLPNRDKAGKDSRTWRERLNRSDKKTGSEGRASEAPTISSSSSRQNEVTDSANILPHEDSLAADSSRLASEKESSIVATPQPLETQQDSSVQSERSNSNEVSSRDENRPQDELPHSDDTSLEKTKTSTLGATDLWLEARNTLHLSNNEREAEEWREFEGSLKLASTFSINQVLLRMKQNGKKIIYRDIFDKFVTWAGAFKDVVSAAAAFDPTHHAQLAWGGVSVLITAAMKSKETRDFVLNIEPVSKMITRYAIVERLYVVEGLTEQSWASQLREALVLPYMNILKYQARVMKYLTQNRIAHAFASLLPTHPIKEAMADIESAKHEVDEFQALAEQDGVKEQFQALRQIMLDLDAPIKRTVAQIDYIRGEIDEWKRNDVLEWISNTQFSDHHSEIKGERMEVGAGKSTLISLVIDTISGAGEDDREEPERCAYFYCDRTSRASELEDPKTILWSLLKQLSRHKNRPIMDSVLEAYERKIGTGHLDRGECVALIGALTDRYPLTTIILDALDEAPIETRTDLCNDLFEIVQNSKSLVKLFISSRMETDIERRFRASGIKPITFNLKIGLGDNEDDISRFVNRKVDSDIADGRLLPGFFFEDEDDSSESLEEFRLKLRQDIKKILLEKSQGMFRWVQLSLQTLYKLNLEAEVRSQLGRLPTELYDLYKEIFDYIMQHPGLKSTLVERTLKWLMYAQSLQTKHFLQIIASNPGESQTEINKMTLLGICRNLIEWDPSQDSFRIAHVSVREFLETKEDYSPSKGHGVLASACLMHVDRCYDLSENSQTPSRNAMCLYSHIWWPWHCHCQIQFCNEGDQLKAFQELEVSFPTIHHKLSYEKWMTQSSVALTNYKEEGGDTNSCSLLSTFPDLLNVLKGGLFFSRSSPLENSGNIMNDYHTSDWERAFLCASRDGNLGIMQTLLESNSEQVNARHNHGWTALHKAATDGRVDLVELLVDNGADIDAKSEANVYVDARSDALVWEGWLRSSGYFVNDKGRLNIQILGAYTPLHLAVSQGHIATVELLLVRKANINARTETKEANIHHKLVINDKGTLDIVVEPEMTALHLAIIHGRWPIVELLLEAGADVNVRSGPFSGEIHFDTLLSNTVKTRVLYKDGITALGYLFEGQRIITMPDHILQSLLAKGAKIDPEPKLSTINQIRRSCGLHLRVKRIINCGGKFELKFQEFNQTDVDLLLINEGKAIFKVQGPGLKFDQYSLDRMKERGLNVEELSATRHSDSESDDHQFRVRIEATYLL